MWAVLDLETSTTSAYKRKANPFLRNEDGDYVNYTVLMGWCTRDNPDPECIRMTRDAQHLQTAQFVKLLEGNQILVGFNIKFDLHHILRDPVAYRAWQDWVAAGGVVFDCQLAEYLLQGQIRESHMLSLDDCCRYYDLDTKVDEVKMLWEAGVDTVDIDPDLLQRYLIGETLPSGRRREGDIGNTRDVFLKQSARIKATGLSQVVKMNMLALVCSIEMEFNGVHVDKQQGLLVAEVLAKSLEELNAELKSHLPADLPFDFNFGNRYHLSPLLFGGQVKYKRRQYDLKDGSTTWEAPTEQTQELYAYAQKTIKVDTGTVYLSGRHAGEPKYRNEGVDDYDKPKSRMADAVYEFPGYAKPKEDWASSTAGLYSVAAEVITELCTTHKHVPFIDKLGKVAALAKDLGTYYITTDDKGEQKGMLTLVMDNGIVHHSLNHTSTVTGRFSASNPNTQNIPKGQKSAVKELFTSRFGDDGMIVSSDFCFAAGTPILTGEFEYQPVETLEVGQELVGFDEHNTTGNMKGRKFRRAIVVAKKRLFKECVRVTVDNGDSFVVSTDHQWLSRIPGRGQSLHWVASSDLRPGVSTLTQAVEYWEPAKGEAAGWCRGILDGEGYVNGGKRGFCTSWGIGQKYADDNLLVCEDIVTNFKECGDDIVVQHARTSNMVRLMGTARGKVRAGWYIVGKYRPRRLLAKVKRRWEGNTTSSKDNHVRTVVSVEPVGMQEVWAVQTSTGTMVAKGYLTHNCSLEVYVQANLTSCDALKAALLNGTDMHCLRLSKKEHMDYDEVVKLCKGYTDDQGVEHPAVPEWDYKRTGAKIFSFQLAYGAGAATIAASTGMTVEEVETLMQAEAELFPETMTYFDELGDIIERKAKPTSQYVGHPDNPAVSVQLRLSRVTVPTGKLYSFKSSPSSPRALRRGIRDSFSPTERKNYPVQGEGAEVMKAAMRLLILEFYQRHNFNGKALLVNTVHDAVYVDCHKDVLEEVTVLVHACMEAATDIYCYALMKPEDYWEVPVPSDTTYGSSMAIEDKPDIKDFAEKVLAERIRIQRTHYSGYCNRYQPN